MSPLPKKIKVGGSWVKGYQTTVATTLGDYVLHADSAVARYVSAFDILADDSGTGDYVTITHETTTGADAEVVATLGNTIYNPGPGRTFTVNLPAAENLAAGETLKFVYTNAGGVAVDFRVYVQFIR